MAVVIFSYPDFIATYPQFVITPEPVLQNDFILATGYLDNTDCSIVVDLTLRTTLLYLLTAHIAILFGQGPDAAGGAGRIGLVGRVSNATEGSVSIQTAFPDAGSATEAWFIQTPFGAAYWTMTLPFRSFNYAPAPADAYAFDANIGGYGYGFGGGYGPWPY